MSSHLDIEGLLDDAEKKATEKINKTPDDKSIGEKHDRNDRHGGRDRRERHDGLPTRYTEDRHGERSRRSRDSVEDEEDIKDSSDKGSANGSLRSRRRSRSPEDPRITARRARFGEVPELEPRERIERRDRERGAYYRPGDRHGSHELTPNIDSYRPGPRGGRDDRSTRGNRGDRDGDRDDDRRRYRARSPEPVRRQKTPELTDDERDRRTVFVQQLAARLRTKELINFFSKVGPVKEAQIVKDRVSGRSKGVGYVEFKDEDSVAKAIELTGQQLLGIPIIAQHTEAEKNRLARNTEGAPTQSNGIPFHRLYVGNIHFSITEDDLTSVFKPFGDLEFVQLQKEDQGRSKGYGFVQFANPAQAKEALEKMNGFELAGRPIRVGLGNDKFTPESTQNLLQRFGSHQAQQNYQGSSFSGMGGRGAHAGGTGNFDRAGGRDADRAGGGASALDDTDVAGVNFSNYSRTKLMEQLAGRDPAPQPQARARTEAPKPVVATTTPSRCVMLSNMYSEAEEVARNPTNWIKELEDDIKDECEQRYGQVVHIGLQRDSLRGEIGVKFDRVQGGTNAFRSLNGRYFNKRMITAAYVVEAIYNSNFPKAANV